MSLCAPEPDPGRSDGSWSAGRTALHLVPAGRAAARYWQGYAAAAAVRGQNTSCPWPVVAPDTVSSDCS